MVQKRFSPVFSKSSTSRLAFLLEWNDNSFDYRKELQITLISLSFSGGTIEYAKLEFRKWLSTLSSFLTCRAAPRCKRSLTIEILSFDVEGRENFESYDNKFDAKLKIVRIWLWAWLLTFAVLVLPYMIIFSIGG